MGGRKRENSVPFGGRRRVAYRGRGIACSREEEDLAWEWKSRNQSSLSRN